MKKNPFIFLTIVSCSFLFSFCFAYQSPNEEEINIIPILEKLWQFLVKFLQIILQAIKKAWSQAVVIWKQIFLFFEEKIGDSIVGFFQKRKQIFLREWPKEKQEMKNSWQELKTKIIFWLKKKLPLMP